MVTENLSRRNTRQRKLVLEAIHWGDHPSARDIFDAIAKTERISLGTVYRNLIILEEAGEIVQVKSDPLLVRYDRRLGPHHHLHCKVCGRVYDMPLPYDAVFDREAAEKSGCRIEGHSITFKGICRACIEKSPENRF
ncbi:transcriptional repressor [Treponema sp. TIM-1]|uniref:Fur family transcriptional regulator n=1 Tax=Treponema sp. TIM-1 TaxID=2898417 RepID=UPI003980F128